MFVSWKMLLKGGADEVSIISQGELNAVLSYICAMPFQ